MLNRNGRQTGTWKSGPGEVANAVKTALRNGYKHLDLAWIYGNEQEVGQGIRDSGVPRDEIFITSKLWCTKHRDVEAAVKESLDLIGTDYLDLCTFLHLVALTGVLMLFIDAADLMHWPVPLNPNGNDAKFPKKEDGSRDLVSYVSLARDPDQLFMRHLLCRIRSGPSTKRGSRWKRSWRRGSSRRLAFPSSSLFFSEAQPSPAALVSHFLLRRSFSEPVLDDLLKTAKVTPAANQVRGRCVRGDSGAGHMLRNPSSQVELHPYLPQHELLEYLEEKGIVAEAYSPLGSTDSPLLKDDDIKKIADKHGVSVGTILISYQGEREDDLLLSVDSP
jgi:glycerol 2-dehydrogenase (NADP+)